MVHRLNRQELTPALESALSAGVDGLTLSQLVLAGRGSAEIDLTSREWQEILEWWDSVRSEHPSITMTTHLAQLTMVAPDLACSPLFQGCQAARGHGAISPTGDVYPCVVLLYRIGNLRRNSFNDLWNNSSAAAILRDRTQLLGLCGKCTFRDKCGGCRATAYAVTGNLMAADPYCWINDQASCEYTL